MDEMVRRHIDEFRANGGVLTADLAGLDIQRVVHLRSDWTSMDTTFRFEPDGEATKLVIESDYEMPGKLPGFLKDLMSKGWMERNNRRMFEDFKALAEAKVPAKV